MHNNNWTVEGVMKKTMSLLLWMEEFWDAIELFTNPERFYDEIVAPSPKQKEGD